MTQPTHAPTPWETYSENEVEYRAIRDAEGHLICTMSLEDHDAQTHSLDRAIKRAKERAAFIVRACNAYESLVKQRDELLEVLKLAKDYVAHSCKDLDPINQRKNLDIINRVFAFAESTKKEEAQS